MKKKYLLLGVMLTTTLLIFTGCYPNNEVYTAESPANFISGLWHGIVVVINFIRSWFNPNVGIYESTNNGFWYNFGFLLAVGAFSTGCSSSKKN
jgi:hypothetical protein